MARAGAADQLGGQRAGWHRWHVRMAEMAGGRMAHAGQLPAQVNATPGTMTAVNPQFTGTCSVPASHAASPLLASPWSRPHTKVTSCNASSSNNRAAACSTSWTQGSGPMLLGAHGCFESSSLPENPRSSEVQFEDVIYDQLLSAGFPGRSSYERANSLTSCAERSKISQHVT